MIIEALEQDTSMDIFLRFRDEMGNVMEKIVQKGSAILLCPYGGH